MNIIRRLALAAWLLIPAAAIAGTPAHATGDYTTTTTLAGSTTGERCRYNGAIPADDPTCPPPCEFDPELAADDPYCEDPSSTQPDTLPPTTTTVAPSTSSTSSAPTTTTAPNPSPDGTSTTTSLPTITAPATSSPNTTTSTVPPLEPSTTAARCDGPLCPRLPTTGPGDTLVPYAVVIAAVGGILVLVASRRRPT